jgi:hypothetical protein
MEDNRRPSIAGIYFSQQRLAEAVERLDQLTSSRSYRRVNEG